MGASTRPSSWAISASSRWPMPAPPYCSGTAVPSQPISATPFQSSLAWVWSDSRTARQTDSSQCSAR